MAQPPRVPTPEYCCYFLTLSPTCTDQESEHLRLEVQDLGGEVLHEYPDSRLLEIKLPEESITKLDCSCVLNVLCC